MTAVPRVLLDEMHQHLAHRDRRGGIVPDPLTKITTFGDRSVRRCLLRGKITPGRIDHVMIVDGTVEVRIPVSI